jgi:tetratricopeptide (TPR) repeat protein
MKYAHVVVRIISPLLFWCFGMQPTVAQADEYSEVAQMTRDGKFVEALNKADAYLAGKPRDPQMRFLKGVAQKDAGKTPEAIATFTKLTEDFPNLPEPYNNLAVLYANQNQFDKAKSALELALKTNPGYAIAYENLGDVYARLSSQAYNKALQIEGTNPAITPKLAMARQLFNSNTGRIAAIGTSPSVVPDKAAPAVIPKPAAPAAPAVVTTPPAATPPAPAAPPAKPPATKADDEPNQGDTKAVEAAVRKWAEAWSDKNLKVYFSSYGKDFEPPGDSKRSAWENDREARIMGKSKISVRLDGLKITVNGNKAIAKFRQYYKADELAVSSRKTLELTKYGDQWRITRESVGS